MKRPSLFKSAPAFAVVLALTSASAHGASKRGGTTSVESKAVAQGTAAQSTQQQGTVNSDSSAEGAARRTSTSSFARRAVEAIKNVVAPPTPVIVENAITSADREITSHVADAEAFLKKTAKEGFVALALESHYLALSVKASIFNGFRSPENQKMAALVDELAKTDEEALHALFILASYRFAASMKEDKPEFASAVDRLEGRLRAAGLARDDYDGKNWHLDPDAAPAVLAAPGARALLHKLTDSIAQKETREALAKERASTLNVAKAQQSIERMQMLKKYIQSMNKKAGIEMLYPAEFMNEIKPRGAISSNGGVVLIVGDGSYATELQTAHGSISYSGGASSYSSNAEKLMEKLKEQLGLELIEERSSTGWTTGFKAYAVTRLPDGTKIPKAKKNESIVVSSKERLELIKQVPAKVRQGLKVEAEG